jgi:tetratricopeptide (TPR) repeat protein
MPRPLLAACIAAATCLLWPAGGRADDLAEQRSLCNRTLTMPPEAVIGACTAMIRSESATAESRSGAYVNRSIAYAKMHDYRRAIDDETAAIQLAPEDASAYKDRGIDRFETHDYAGSLSDLERYANLHFPPEPDAVHGIALDDYLLGRTEDALIAATASIRARAGNADALLLRAQIFQLMNMPEFAYLDEEQIAAIPDHWATTSDILVDRAQANAFVGSYDRALSDLHAVLKREPQNVQALSLRCFYFAVLGRYNDALHDCGVALTIRPNDESTLESRGSAYYMMHQYAKALHDLRAAVFLDPTDSEAFYVLGLTENAMGSAAAARRDVARAQQLGKMIPARRERITFNKPYARPHYDERELAFWQIDQGNFGVTSVQLASYSGRLYVDEETNWRNQPMMSVTYEVPFSALTCMTPNRSSGSVTLVAGGDDSVVAYFPQTNGTAATQTVTLKSWGRADDLERLLRKKLPRVRVCA